MPRRLTHSQEGRNEKAAPHGGYCNAGVVVRHSGARSTPGALVRSGATLVVGGPAADKSNCGAPKERADSKGQGAEGTTAMILRRDRRRADRKGMASPASK